MKKYYEVYDGLTFSGLWAPGPGFRVESVGSALRPVML